MQGSNENIAIIGRAMGNKTIKGVRDVHKKLQVRGYRNVEIFDESSLTGEWLIRYRNANDQMEDLTNKWTKWLNNQDIVNIKMYQLNKEWAEKLMKEKYTIIDLGDIPLKAGDYKGFSPFYGIEKKIIFGGE